MLLSVSYKSTPLAKTICVEMHEKDHDNINVILPFTIFKSPLIGRRPYFVRILLQVMSVRKGNNAKKGQKYQNVKAFRNDLHDTSKATKQINSLVVGGVCARCREVIEWKKKYKKYKPLTAPKKCVRCEQKTVKHAYHTVCSRCAGEAKLCEKCGNVQHIVVKSDPSASERAAQDSMLQQEVKAMTERQRRTFFRRHENEDAWAESAANKCHPSNDDDEDSEDDDDDDDGNDKDSLKADESLQGKS